MDEMNAAAPTTNKNGPLVSGETSLWQEVATASAERDLHEWTWDDVEDVIEVRVSDAEKAAMLSLNGADESEKEQIESEIAALKEELKDKKAEVTSIASRMKDRNRTGAKGVQARRCKWKVGTCFALNTIRYVDPSTGLVVHERPLTQAERQLELAVDAALKPAVDDSPDSSGDEADVTDPVGLLDAAKKGEGPTPSDTSLDNEDDGDDYDGADDEGDDA